MGPLLDFLYLLGGLLFFPFYYRRLKRTGRDTSQIWQRLKAPPLLSPDIPRVLVHAVSVGEVQAAVPFVNEMFRILSSDVEVVLSVGTSSGREQAQRRLPDVPVFFMPPDLSFLVKRMLRRVKPSLLVLMELELWPNLIRYAGRAGIPVVVVNGRISERSFAGYRRLGRFFRGVLASVRIFGVQNTLYARRLMELGVPHERIAVLGNVKFDLALEPRDAHRLAFLRKTYGLGEETPIAQNPKPTDSEEEHSTQPSAYSLQPQASSLKSQACPVLIAGSTHPGEEETIVSVYRRLRQQHPRLRLILAPRHPGRVPEVLPLLKDLDVTLRSTLRGGAAHDVIVVDTIGELAYLYHLADVAFIGGSLIPHGGQNPLEAAAAGAPCVFGPHMFNFEPEAKLLLDAGGARQVSDAAGLEQALAAWLADAEARRRAGSAARAAIEPSRGAAARYAEVARKYLAESMG